MMTDEVYRAEKATQLRKRAEAMVQKKEAPSLNELQAAYQELQAHHIELEMQNEALLRTQEKLETLRAKYFDLYNLSSVGSITLSQTGIMVESNLTASNMLGIVRENLLNQPLNRL